MSDEPERGVVWLLSMLKGGIVNDADTALKLAELVIASAYGAEEVEQQRPLTATDQADRWLIEGSLNKDRKVEGRGAVKVLIRKSDCRVLDLAVPIVMFPHPDAKKYLDRDKS
jgi:hypothetical protein